MVDRPSVERPYDAAWFANRNQGLRESAETVLGSVLELLRSRDCPVSSVVDVGAGLGTWLAVARDLGVDDVVAVEGEWVRGLQTDVPQSHYVFADVGDALTMPRRFDLAISLEVAEHVPEAKASNLIENIAAFSDVVLFSAAVPGQGGKHHVNERWPEYWAHLFGRKDFVPYDLLRWRLWGDDRVRFWYRQNLILFVRRDREALCRALDALSWRDVLPSAPPAVVHPELYARLTRFYDRPALGWLLRRLPGALSRAISRRSRRMLGSRRKGAD